MTLATRQTGRLIATWTVRRRLVRASLAALYPHATVVGLPTRHDTPPPQADRTMSGEGAQWGDTGRTRLPMRRDACGSRPRERLFWETQHPNRSRPRSRPENARYRRAAWEGDLFFVSSTTTSATVG